MKLTAPRIVQLLFLAIFLALFIATEYRGKDEITAAVNAFFRVDPLVLFSYLLAVKSWEWLLLPALIMVVATLFLGRFFCGWICPLGTVLDVTTRFFPKTLQSPLKGKSINVWLAVALLSASLFGLNLAGILDPLAILLRGLSFFLHPLIGIAARTGWVELYHGIGERRDAVAPLYAFFRDHLLPFRDTWYQLAFLSAAMLCGVFYLERCGKRTWCRDLCPLGGVLGLLSRRAFFKRRPSGICGDCGRCVDTCPTAFTGKNWEREGCLLCMECVADCPHNRVIFSPGRAKPVGRDFLPGRRAFIGSTCSGILLGTTFRFNEPRQFSMVLRPPGVRSESEFLAKCVRCGECMKVCLRNALYPALFQADWEGFYTPLLIPRLGYCEYNCTLCGQVCPTGAIPQLSVETKKREVIGKAVFDRNHCLPFARQIDCIVCEEHCPIPGKAIRSREIRVFGTDGLPRIVKEPYVVEEICNGCGICEFVCPLETKTGIDIFAVKNRAPLADPAAADTL